MQMVEKYRAVRAHKPDTPDGLIVTRGERLRCEQRQTAWLGWIWCTSAEGHQAWVPESWLRRDGEAWVTTRAYDSRELPVDVGDEVTLELTESGWAWVHNDRGERGWVPAECLEKVTL